MLYLPNFVHNDKINYETLIDRDNLVIGRCVLPKKNELFIHKHSLDEIYMITGGSGMVYRENKWVTVKKNDYFLIKAGDYHGAKASENEDLEFTYIFPTGKFGSIKYEARSKL